MKKFASGVAALAVISLSVLCACRDSGKSSYYKTYYAMDTAARLFAADVKESEFNTLADKVESFLSDVENSLSVARSNSYVCKFNRAAAGAAVEIDRTCYEVLTLAKEVYAETDGCFNPAVYYCEDIYGFAARTTVTGAMPYDREGDTPSLPDGKYVTAFKELSEHFSEVEIYELDGTYYATKPNFTVKVDGDDNEYSLALDLGGIAKGWCADKVNAMMTEAGMEYGYFNFGVSSMSVKKYLGGDNNYSVAAGDPRGSGPYTSFKMQNANLSTSGDNHKYYEIDGTRYCHIIDPHTGSPVRTDVATVTIVGGPAGRSDALTTALSAMDMQSAAQFINDNMTDCKVIMLIYRDGAGKVLTNAPDYFKIENKNYTLANTVENGRIVLS